MTGVRSGQGANAAILLIVEDEPLQRLDMIDMAERAGFDVVKAHSAEHAVAILERRADLSPRKDRTNPRSSAFAARRTIALT